MVNVDSPWWQWRKGVCYIATPFPWTGGKKGKLQKLIFRSGDRGDTVVKVLCYKSEGRWLDPSWCQWIFH